MLTKIRTQAMIINSISEVKAELRAAHAAGESKVVIFPILERLSALYSLLDLDIISDAINSCDKEQSNAA